MVNLLSIAEDAPTRPEFTLPTWFPWILVGIGVVLLTVVVVVATSSRRRDAQREAAERAKSAAEITDLRNQLVEVKRLAAAVAEDLDRRAEKLERLIAEADGMLDRPPIPAPRRLSQPTDSPPVDDLAQRIFMLADQGKSPVQIAQVLRQPVGNIELMLALRGGR